MIISERVFSDPKPLTIGRCRLSSVRKKSPCGKRRHLPEQVGGVGCRDAELFLKYP